MMRACTRTAYTAPSSHGKEHSVTMTRDRSSAPAAPARKIAAADRATKPERDRREIAELADFIIRKREKVLRSLENR